MESPDYLYVNSGGALSPSLWDEDWKETPDALKNDVILGSPQSSVLPYSFDGRLIPDDDDLMWMEKSCNLESLTELHDVSVQDVDEIPMEDKSAVLSPSIQQIPYDTGNNGEAVVSDGLFKVEGVEDLFHDYIDPDVYMVKDDRRVTVDSCVSNDGDIQDSFFSSTRDHPGKLSDYNEKQRCVSRIDDRQASMFAGSLPDFPLTSEKLTETQFVNSLRPILPKFQGFKMPQPQTKNPKIYTVLPVSTQQSIRVKPVTDSVQSIVFKPNSPLIPIKIRKVLTKTKATNDLNGVVTKGLTIVQNSILNTESTQKFNQRTEFRTSEKTMPAKEASIDNFLNALKKKENITPLEALLQESNNAKIKQPISYPPNQEVWYTHGSRTEIASPVRLVEDFSEPIISNLTSFPKQSVEVITYDSIMGSSVTDNADCTLQLENIVVTRDSDVQRGHDTTAEMLDFTESSPLNDFQVQSNDSYLDASDLSCDSLSPSNTTSYSPGPRKVGRRRGSLPPEEKKNRKKVQNKEAAIRYRQKKKCQYDMFIREENELNQKNKKLRSEKDGIVTEIKYLKGLLRDIYKAKGLIK